MNRINVLLGARSAKERPMWTPDHRRAADRRGLRYPSDLTDDEWAIVEPMIPPARHGGHKRSVNVREVLNGIFYVLWTGCQRRHAKIRCAAPGLCGGALESAGDRGDQGRREDRCRHSSRIGRARILQPSVRMCLCTKSRSASYLPSPRRPTKDRATSALAEQERRMIGQRTSARLAAAKGCVEDRTRVADQSARLRRTRDDHTG